MKNIEKKLIEYNQNSQKILTKTRTTKCQNRTKEKKIIKKKTAKD